jgi:cytochrome P450
MYYAPRLAALFARLSGLTENIQTPVRAEAYILEKSKLPDPEAFTISDRLQSNVSGLPFIEQAAECMDHMAAGIDTTGDALVFLIHHLSLESSRPIQLRLQKELIGNPNAKLDELPYLDALIKEGLRVYPPGPISLPRLVPSGGREISGYDVPADTIVSCQVFTVQRFDTVAFPDPDTFNPERWLEPDGLLERNRLFFAFGAGGRGCIGRK